MTCCHEDHQTDTSDATVMDRARNSIVPAVLGALIGAAIGGD